MNERRQCESCCINGFKSTEGSLSAYPQAQTLDLKGAAKFLHMHPKAVRQQTKAGEIPGAKPGKTWVFLVQDLVRYVQSLYPSSRQALQAEVTSCPFINAKAPRTGIFDLHRQAASELDAVLKVETKQKLESSKTNLKQKRGESSN